MRRELRAVRYVASRDRASEVLLELSYRDGDRGPVFLDEAYAPADFDAELLGRKSGRGIRLVRRTRMEESTVSGRRPALRDFNIEELLARLPIDLAIEKIKRMIAGWRVLTTDVGCHYPIGNLS